MKSAPIWVVSMLAAVASLFVAGCRNECKVSGDCTSAQVRAERCGPELICKSGQCRSRCTPSCVTVSPEVDACEGELICSHSRSDESERGDCVGAPIRCQTAEDCPIYRPSDDGEWSCVEERCRFPGFEYAYP